LFWYWVNTSPDATVPISYECDHCGEKHTILLNMNDLIAEYKPIQGKAEREFEFDGETITVHPLNGADMEALELERLVLEEIAVEKGESSGEYRKKLAQIRLFQFLYSVCAARDNSKLKAAQEKILKLPERTFVDLVKKTAEKLTEMEHGLKSEYVNGEIFLLTPPHKCPKKGKEDFSTRLRVPFRSNDYIPSI